MAKPSRFTSCEVLHEDAVLLIINKPAAILSHPNGPHDAEPIAFQGSYDTTQRCFTSEAGKVWLIHRLDEGTSGVLLAAKSELAAQRCRAAFEQDRVRKHYTMLVSGTNMKPSGVWLDHLTTLSGGNTVRTKVVPKAKPNAELSYRVVKQNREHRASLLDIDLITGKTHQIRVQAASRSWPILGDEVYGDFALNRQLRKDHGPVRLCLHAASLELKHPTSQVRLKLTAPLPEAMVSLAIALGVF
jgi:RluA family pseudouridine synthase